VKLKGDVQTLRRLFENEYAARAGHQAPHRILLIGTGGGMCCIRVAAYLTAWRDAGLEHAVDHGISVSGSGDAVGAFLSGLSCSDVRAPGGLRVREGQLLAPTPFTLPYLAEILRGNHNPISLWSEKDMACTS
jgi:hypothetical protein